MLLLLCCSYVAYNGPFLINFLSFTVHDLKKLCNYFLCKSKFHFLKFCISVIFKNYILCVNSRHAVFSLFSRIFISICFPLCFKIFFAWFRMMYWTVYTHTWLNQLTKGNIFSDLSHSLHVNFTKILREAFLYESFMRSLFVLTL